MQKVDSRGVRGAKRLYRRPELQVIGSVTELTQQASIPGKQQLTWDGNGSGPKPFDSGTGSPRFGF